MIYDSSTRNYYGKQLLTWVLLIKKNEENLFSRIAKIILFLKKIIQRKDSRNLQCISSRNNLLQTEKLEIKRLCSEMLYYIQNTTKVNILCRRKKGQKKKVLKRVEHLGMPKALYPGRKSKMSNIT